VTYTIESAPPARRETTQKRSRWQELFAEARQFPGQWRRMVEPLKKSTASQIASDIRNAHQRDLSKSRLRGLLPTDEWEAAWGNDASDPNPEHFYVWLKYTGEPVGDGNRPPQQRRRRSTS
jgi:hypothetical protein